MIEIPEANSIARQLNETVLGKEISNVIAARSPHKFAWFHGDPQAYNSVLAGKSILGAGGFGGLVEIMAGDSIILFGDGVSIKYYDAAQSRPDKHQLLVEFTDGSALIASVQMYGGLWCFIEGEFDNPYYKVAKIKPSPLSDQFNKPYFDNLVSLPVVQKLSAKAFLATEQRVPGLGNGVLQDVLWKSRIHPKRKVNTLGEEDRDLLFQTIKSLIAEMAGLRGRDTEKDLFGNAGGYKTMMSKNSAGLPCMVCGGYIKKENYMGGSVYYCEKCQVV